MRTNLVWRSILIAGALLGLALTIALVVSNFRKSAEGIVLKPQGVSSEQLVDNLSSSDPHLLTESLMVLKERRAGAGISKALDLLANKDPYVWVNAAEYLGSVGRTEAVPYLIKALRHSSHRGDSERLDYLKKITGENFDDFEGWKNWYIQHRGEWQGDWDSNLGPVPRR